MATLFMIWRIFTIAICVVGIPVIINMGKDLWRDDKLVLAVDLVGCALFAFFAVGLILI